MIEVRPFVLLHDRAFFGEAIPWAGFEANVASVNSSADRRAKLFRDRAFQFDREIGNAAARIELERTGDGVRGTGGDAALARAAAIRFGSIWRKFERGNDFGNEEPVPE